MPAAYGIEASIDAIIAKLEAELPAKLDAINAEIGDAFVLERPAAISFGPRSEIQYPWVCVTPSTTDLLSDASGREQEEHRVSAISWLQSGDEEALARLLTRYNRAVKEVVLHFRRPAASFVSGAGGYGLQYAGSDYGPAFQTEGATDFYSWVSSNFTIQAEQDLP